MIACDQMKCSKKKICKVYEMIQKFKGEIDIEVSNCVYNGLIFQSIKADTNKAVSVASKIRDSKEINENSAKIHALLEEKEKTAPNTTRAARFSGMQFTVDGEEQT